MKTVEELVGRTDLLQRSRHINPKSKAASLDIEKLLHAVDGPNTKEIAQNHHLDIGFDLNYLYKEAKQSIENGETFKGQYTINNTQRNVGVITVVILRSNMVVKVYLKKRLLQKRWAMLGKV